MRGVVKLCVYWKEVRGQVHPTAALSTGNECPVPLSEVSVL